MSLCISVIQEQTMWYVSICCILPLTLLINHHLDKDEGVKKLKITTNACPKDLSHLIPNYKFLSEIVWNNVPHTLFLSNIRPIQNVPLAEVWLIRNSLCIDMEIYRVLFSYGTFLTTSCGRDFDDIDLWFF